MPCSSSSSARKFLLHCNHPRTIYLSTSSFSEKFQLGKGVYTVQDYKRSVKVKNMCSAFFDKISRIGSMMLKKFKRIIKHKTPSNPFLKTVKIFSVPLDIHVECKMILDSGCDRNIVSVNTLRRLYMLERMNRQHEDLCICLNGGELSSIGTITLCWKGKQFRRIFTTTFHVIEGDAIPYEVILGSKSISEYGILKFAGFGGLRMDFVPRKTKALEAEKKKDHSKRKAAHRDVSAVNDAKVDADIRRREEAARWEQTTSDESTTSAHGDYQDHDTEDSRKESVEASVRQILM